MDKIRVLIVDDSPLMREALRSILSSDPDIDVVGMAKNLKQALEQALSRVGGLDHDALVRRGIDRLMAYGAFETVNA